MEIYCDSSVFPGFNLLDDLRVKNGKKKISVYMSFILCLIVVWMNNHKIQNKLCMFHDKMSTDVSLFSFFMLLKCLKFKSNKN